MARFRILDGINLSTKLDILGGAHKVVLQRQSCLRRLVYETFGIQIGIKHTTFILNSRLRQFVSLAADVALKPRWSSLSLTSEYHFTNIIYLGWVSMYDPGFL